MKGLGLRYRFTCAVIDSRTRESLPQIIGTPLPPTQEWWDNNWILVNGCYILDTNSMSIFAFCTPKSKFNDYWPLIRLMYNFLSKYAHDQYWFTSEETGVEFWKAVES